MVIEAGSSPELREVREGIAALSRAVLELVGVQEHNTKLLERLVERVDEEPEGEPVREVLAQILTTLNRLPAQIEQAVVQGMRAKPGVG